LHSSKVAQVVQTKVGEPGLLQQWLESPGGQVLCAQWPAVDGDDIQGLEAVATFSKEKTARTEPTMTAAVEDYVAYVALIADR
jgi:hypothetical protein